jgi:uncharacterized protein YciI
MPIYVLTVTSPTGERVNPITGSPSDSIAVYSDEDLADRLAAVKADPRHLTATYTVIGPRTAGAQ